MAVCQARACVAARLSGLCRGTPEVPQLSEGHQATRTVPDNRINSTISSRKLARIFHELVSRDHADGRATWKPSRGTAGLAPRRT
jgi:hypothetical protein